MKATQKPNRIDTLLATNPNAIGNAALKAAVEKLQKENEEKQAARALATLTWLTKYLEAKVDCLREIRKQEKQALEAVNRVDDALNKFQNGELTDVQEVVAAVLGQESNSYEVGYTIRLHIDK